MQDLSSSVVASSRTSALRPGRAALFGSLPVLLAGSLLAQSGPPPASKPQADARPQGPQQPIPEVVVSASDAQAAGELERTPLDNTAGRDVIRPDELRTGGVISLQEILRRSPGVHTWDETGSESLPNVALRGVTANDGASRSLNLAMTVDGIPLSSAPYGHPGSSLFPLTLERVYAVDIQRGGASVRYGPNNVAGVVNFLTKPIPTATTFELGTRLDSFNNASQYASAGGTYENLGVFVEGVYKDGDTFRQNGEYEIQNYALKTAYAFSEDLRVLFQLESFDDQSNLADGLSLADYKADRFQSTALQNRFEGDQTRASTKVEWKLTDRTRLEFISYWYDSSRTFFLGSPTGYINNPTYIQATPRPMEVWAFQPQIAHEYELFGAKAELFAGVRHLEENIRRRVERFFPNNTYSLISNADFDYSANSVFVETTLVKGDWRVTPGVRVEDVRIDGQDTITANAPKREQDFSEVLPSLSASYLVSDTWSVYANVQSSFKAPEAQYIDLTVNPQDLSAQYAWVYELGTRGEFFERRLAADLTLYQIEYEDRIEPNPDIFNVFDNIGRTRHQGVELALDGDLSDMTFDGLTAFASASYNDSEYLKGQYEGNELTGTPHWLLSWGVRWEHARSGFWTGIDGVYVDDAFSDRDNTVAINAAGTRGIRPSYSIWNARVGLRRQLSKNCQLRATVLTRNLFDEEYFEVRSGRGLYAGAPFSYGAELGLTFSF